MRNESLPYATRSRSSIVDGLAWGFIAFSILSLVLLVLFLLPNEALPTTLNVESGSGGLTGGVDWLIERSRAFTSLLLLGAGITLGLSIALLQRRRWARLAFIGLMGIGFIAVLGGVALTPLTFGFLADASVEVPSTENPVANLTGTLAVLIMISTALLILFAWASWKLVTPDVRTEFEPISDTQGG